MSQDLLSQTVRTKSGRESRPPPRWGEKRQTAAGPSAHTATANEVTTAPTQAGFTVIHDEDVDVDAHEFRERQWRKRAREHFEWWNGELESTNLADLLDDSHGWDEIDAMRDAILAEGAPNGDSGNNSPITVSDESPLAPSEQQVREEPVSDRLEEIRRAGQMARSMLGLDEQRPERPDWLGKAVEANRRAREREESILSSIVTSPPGPTPSINVGGRKVRRTA